MDPILEQLTGLAGGGEETGGTTGTPLDVVLDPIADLAGGAGEETGGTTGTPLDAVVDPVADVASGAGIPVDTVIAPLTSETPTGTPVDPVIITVARSFPGRGETGGIFPGGGGQTRAQEADSTDLMTAQSSPISTESSSLDSSLFSSSTLPNS